MDTYPAGTFFQLTPWVVFLPLLGLLINLLFSQKFSERTIGLVASLAAGASFLVACLLLRSIQIHPEAVVVPFATWIEIGNFSVNWAFRVDTLSVTMMLVVSGVGTLIHFYSIGYMHEDVRHQGDPSRFARFFIFLNLFILMMMVLVSAESYLMTFVGWEGVGLCSYLLIGFWYEKGKDGSGNAIAAKKAFLTNRIGDFGFLAAMFLLFTVFHSLNFSDIIQSASSQQPASLVFLGINLFLLLAVTGKSAQIPLFVWLPDAMAGPTPVSALIHAATMVTAGVYLVTRSAPLFDLHPLTQQIVAMVGALTALFAATIAVAQTDIKKVLAYSTISQLGFMVAAVGMGAYVAGMFHLVTHAFFKALLFLASGAVIQGVEFGHHHTPHHDGAEEFDPQDMRTMGGLALRMPTTFKVYVVGALALAGIPPLAGFFSKDEIIAFASHNQPVILVLLLAAAFLTAFYMGRQVWMVFAGQPRSEAAAGAVESGRWMLIPLIILGILSVLGGLINFPGLEPLAKWLEHSVEGKHAAQFSFLTAGIAVTIALGGILGAWFFYGRKPLRYPANDPLQKWIGPLYKALERKWWVDEIYDFLFLTPFKDISAILAKPVDQTMIDGLVNGSAITTGWISGVLRKLNNGMVRLYAFFILVGLAAILGVLILN